MPNETNTCDVVIIGGGPAGIVGAATAKAFHQTVALVDNPGGPLQVRHD